MTYSMDIDESLTLKEACDMEVFDMCSVPSACYGLNQTWSGIKKTIKAYLMMIYSTDQGEISSFLS